MALQNVEANITLDLYNHDTTPATVKAIQLDSQTRYVAAMLQSMGAEYGLDSGATVQLIVIRPDKVGVQITGTTFTYGDESSEYLGPYAELTQVALAVNGKMRGQFKITSGTQILRTEIFAISNGEALDASTDEWADEYDGYNLEEMATSIETNTADIASLEADVSQIKEDLSHGNERIDEVKNVVVGLNDDVSDISGNIPIRPIEIGWAYISNGEIAYTNSANGARLKKGWYLDLKQGDVIKNDNSSNYDFRGGYSTDNGSTWTNISWQSTTTYTVPTTGIYIFTFRDKNGTISDINQHIAHFTIIRDSGILMQIESCLISENSTWED